MTALGNKQIIAIVGATGTGKSMLADRLALALDGEVVSADSMQVYRGMDIGTAKLPVANRSVSYHCLDLVDPNEAFNAAMYQKVARNAIDDIIKRGKQPIFCGGTGLYLRAALDDFKLDDTDSHIDIDLRTSLQKQADSLGAEGFHAKLAARDAASAALIHPHNVRRVVRAFELLQQGSSYAKQSSGFSNYKERYVTLWLGVRAERLILYEYINKRVDNMIKQGLLDEVETLVNKGFGQAITALQAIGYKELLAHLNGLSALSTAIDDIKQATRRYAKRQCSWFKRDTRIHWLDTDTMGALTLDKSLTDERLEHALGVLQDTWSGK